MSETTHFVCQTYTRAERSNGRNPMPQLVQGKAIQCKSMEDAEARANRLFEGGSYAGVDAYSIAVDIELGDYSEPVFITRLGDVPELED
ncbi:MAG: hypothetical protein WBC85_09715 [Planktotalea sp.]|uniref:hypothetical protein n=1 Tax=Planktotalea sp. TaxID=2029877 RepID=UPI003C77D2F2